MNIGRLHPLYNHNPMLAAPQCSSVAALTDTIRVVHQQHNDNTGNNDKVNTALMFRLPRTLTLAG